MCAGGGSARGPRWGLAWQYKHCAAPAGAVQAAPQTALQTGPACLSKVPTPPSSACRVERVGRDGERSTGTTLHTPTTPNAFCCLQRAELNERAEAASAALTRERLSNTVDMTGTTIGKRCVHRVCWVGGRPLGVAAAGWLAGGGRREGCFFDLCMPSCRNQDRRAIHRHHRPPDPTPSLPPQSPVLPDVRVPMRVACRLPPPSAADPHAFLPPSPHCQVCAYR